MGFPTTRLTLPKNPLKADEGESMKQKNILDVLIQLYADQCGVKITYDSKEKENVIWQEEKRA